LWSKFVFLFCYAAYISIASASHMLRTTQTTIMITSISYIRDREELVSATILDVD